MSADVSEELRARIRARRSATGDPWHFPAVADFQWSLRVLACDGTLTNFGWVLMRAAGGRFEVLDKGTIRPKTSETSYRETWDKACQLDSELGSAFFDSYARGCDAIVVEAPSVGGGFRTESSLIAGLVIMLRFRDGSNVCPVSATHVSAVLLGDAKVVSARRKPMIRAAVERLYPDSAGRGWNEHERDAFATGAVYLYDEKERFLS